MTIHEMTRASIFIKGSLKSHLFLIFRNLNHLFSTRKWTPEIRICHGCIRKIERAVRTAERLGCLTISSDQKLVNGSIGADDRARSLWDRVDLRTTGHHQTLIIPKSRHSLIQSNQILYNALHRRDNVAINESAGSIRLHKLICCCRAPFLTGSKVSRDPNERQILTRTPLQFNSILALCCFELHIYK